MRRGLQLPSSSVNAACVATAIAFSWALFMFTCVPAARAQETREHDLPQLEEEAGALDYVKTRLKLSNRFIAKADFGEFEANSYQPEAQLRVTAPVSKSVLLQLVGRSRFLIYDFQDRADLGTGAAEDPFDTLISWTARLQSGYLFPEDFTFISKNERWSAFAEVASRAHWERGSRMRDGLRWAGALGFGYRLGDRLQLVAGFSLGNNFEGKLRAAPLLELVCMINDSWSLRTLGRGLEIERKLTDNVTLFTRARFESGKYRLERRSRDIGKGTLSSRQLPVGAGLLLKFSKHVRLRIAAGVVAYNRLKLKDEDGDTLGSETAKPSAYAMLRIDIRP